MMNVKQFKDQEFLSIETFRKNGSGVKTTVWFAQEGDMLYIWTIRESGKAKRIRNNARVNIAPCKRFGKVTGKWMAAQASVDDSAAAARHVETLLRRKLGFVFAVFRMMDRLRDRLTGKQRVSIKVSLS
ncbi:MAG TPA: PPOX class F420-dependent oxidoreductase [Terriglobales bacterium]|nr:PPOX class F420-dependent oxidoreductase [Terriglobales bacterium]